MGLEPAVSTLIFFFSLPPFQLLLLPILLLLLLLHQTEVITKGLSNLNRFREDKKRETFFSNSNFQFLRGG